MIVTLPVRTQRMTILRKYSDSGNHAKAVISGEGKSTDNRVVREE